MLSCNSELELDHSLNQAATLATPIVLSILMPNSFWPISVLTHRLQWLHGKQRIPAGVASQKSVGRKC